MTYKDIGTLLLTTGLPVAYQLHKAGTHLPAITYESPGTNNFAADDIAYVRVDRVIVRLYTENRDPESEGKVETALSSLFWDKTVSYISDEEGYEIMYEFEV